RFQVVWDARAADDDRGGASAGAQRRQDIATEEQHRIFVGRIGSERSHEQDRLTTLEGVRRWLSLDRVADDNDAQGIRGGTQPPIWLAHTQNGGTASRQTQLSVNRRLALGVRHRWTDEMSAPCLAERIDGLRIVDTGSAERGEIGADRGLHIL